MFLRDHPLICPSCYSHENVRSVSLEHSFPLAACTLPQHKQRRHAGCPSSQIGQVVGAGSSRTDAATNVLGIQDRRIQRWRYNGRNSAWRLVVVVAAQAVTRRKPSVACSAWNAPRLCPRRYHRRWGFMTAFEAILRAHWIDRGGARARPDSGACRRRSRPRSSLGRRLFDRHRHRLTATEAACAYSRDITRAPRPDSARAKHGARPSPAASCRSPSFPAFGTLAGPPLAQYHPLAA